MKHFDAKLHVRGESLFTADLPEPQGTLHASVFTSPFARGEILSVHIEEASSLPGVHRIITAEDIPGGNQIGNILKDEPLLAEIEIHYAGQPIAVILAETEETARVASSLIRISFREETPVSDPREAYRQGSLLVPPRTFSSGDPVEARKECRWIVSGTAETGGQEHLYLETQCALCVPGEDDTLVITSSTQGASYVQKTAASVLGLPIHKIQVDVPRLGGAFGGKEDQATPWAVMTALGACLTGRPVRLVLQRDEDMTSTGKRHPYSCDFTIGLSGEGRILTWEVDYFQNSGAAGDLSTAILERTLFHSTGSYNIPNVRATGYCCRTNIAPNTAFRGFGGPQAMFAIEAAIHKAAEVSGIPVHTIQQQNLLAPGDIFPYGMEYTADDARGAWKTCSEMFHLKEALLKAESFNVKNTDWLRKGVSMMPVCFGISFTTTFLNQANALVHVYTDGSVGISTGAVEMGQGVNSRIRQVAAEVFCIPVHLTRVESTNTTRNANTSATAASSGADMNGNAVRLACGEIKARILARASEKLGCPVNQLEVKNGILIRNGDRTGVSWVDMVADAYFNRISLSSHAHYATPGIHFNTDTGKGRPFAYHVCGTALTEVTVDCMLGTYTVDSVRIVHYGGKQLNPLLDLGQVEGALVQGMGWVTMEELCWDENTGRLLSDSLATYKVPGMDFTPGVIQVVFKEGEVLPEGVGLLGSKAVGEPPFMYGIGTWFALADAVKAFSPHCALPYTSPLTPEKLLMALREAE